MSGLKAVLIILFLIGYLYLVAFIDFQVVTPLLPLPDDTCFYHLNSPPIWVEFLYLDTSGHIAPSGLHMLLIFLLSLSLSIFTEKKLSVWLTKRKVKINGYQKLRKNK